MRPHKMATGLALGAFSLAAAPAFAQSVEFGADALVGIARDDRPLAGKKEPFSGGVLPSLQLETGGFTLQADGMLFDHRKESHHGGAIHAGAKLGPVGFVGVYGSVSSMRFARGLETRRIGGEFAFDLGPVTLTAVAGREKTERRTILVTTTATDNVFHVYGRGTKFFSFADAKVKLPGLGKLSIGHRYTGGRHAAALSAGVKIIPALSLVSHVRMGKGDYKAGFVGLRFSFGGLGDGDTDLLDNRLLDDLFAPNNTRRTLLVPLPPPPNGGGGNGCCGGYCET